MPALEVGNVRIYSGKTGSTEDGAHNFQIAMINKTGASSVYGTAVVNDSAVDRGVIAAPADALDCIGAIAEDGIADGSEVWVAVCGTIHYLLENSTASTRGYWVRVSSAAAGRVDATNAAPPGAVLSHFYEVGHAAESITAGTDKLVLVNTHFL